MELGTFNVSVRPRRPAARRRLASSSESCCRKELSSAAEPIRTPQFTSAPTDLRGGGRATGRSSLPCGRSVSAHVKAFSKPNQHRSQINDLGSSQVCAESVIYLWSTRWPQDSARQMSVVHVELLGREGSFVSPAQPPAARRPRGPPKHASAPPCGAAPPPPRAAAHNAGADVNTTAKLLNVTPDSSECVRLHESDCPIYCIREI